MTEVKSYPYGTRLRHICRVEVNDQAADPTGIMVYFIDPLGNQTGPFTPTKDAQGLYELQRTYTSSVPTAIQGQWQTFWRGTGAAEGAAIRQFNITTINIGTTP